MCRRWIDSKPCVFGNRKKQAFANILNLIRDKNKCSLALILLKYFGSTLS
jgi:hypothetical protein